MICGYCGKEMVFSGPPETHWEGHWPFCDAGDVEDLCIDVETVLKFRAEAEALPEWPEGTVIEFE